MSGQRDFSLTFTGPGSRELRAAGRYLRVLSTPADDVYISIGGGSELQRGAGQGIYEPAGFDRFVIRSAVAQAVRVTVSDVPQDDNRQNVAVSVSATVAGSTAITPQAVVTVPAGNKAKIADVNADRIELRVSIASTEPGPVYLGDSTIVAGEGGILEPGMVDYLATTAEVWAYNAGGSPVDVSVVELEAP